MTATTALHNLTLGYGHHQTPADGMCLMEAVAWWAGEAHSDHPRCTSTVLAWFARGWNDGMRTDQERDQLVQYVPRLAGTTARTGVETRRSWLAIDWLIREAAPAWLTAASLGDVGDRLAQLPPLTDTGDPLLEVVQLVTAAEAATLQRLSAHGVDRLAYMLAEERSRTAFHASAVGAAYSAGSSMVSRHRAGLPQTLNACRNAATLVTLDEPGSELMEMTVKQVQQSAHDLFDRMITTT